MSRFSFGSDTNMQLAQRGLQAQGVAFETEGDILIVNDFDARRVLDLRLGAIEEDDDQSED
jgi:sugar lactone lactonase YvrE